MKLLGLVFGVRAVFAGSREDSSDLGGGDPYSRVENRAADGLIAKSGKRPISIGRHPWRKPASADVLSRSSLDYGGHHEVSIDAVSGAGAMCRNGRARCDSIRRRCPILQTGQIGSYDLGPQLGLDAAARAAQDARDEQTSEAFAKAFEHGLPTAKVVRIPHADHYVFQSNETAVLKGDERLPGWIEVKSN